MLKMCCFASGSKGNCCYVSDGDTDILIDLGISASRAEACLNALGVNPDRVHVLVTHSHTDHIGGIKMFAKKHAGAIFHCQKESAAAVVYNTKVQPTVDERTFSIGNITVVAVPVSHDVPCFGYIIKSEDRAVAVVTDIGTVKPNLLMGLSECSLVMLEANHDVERLMRNPVYPPQLKARIRSVYGHLSNADCAQACAFLAGHGVRNFILAHLSEDNNDPALAVSAVSDEIAGLGITDARIVAALQHKPTGLFEVC